MVFIVAWSLVWKKRNREVKKRVIFSKLIADRLKFVFKTLSITMSNLLPEAFSENKEKDRWFP